MPFSPLTKSGRTLRLAAAWLLRKVSNRQFLIGAAVAVGLWAGLMAVVLKVSVNYLRGLLVPLGEQYPWLYLVSPGIGIFAAFLFVRVFLNGDLRKGTSHVLLAIAKKSSFLPRRETFSHVVTSALTVGMGGSAGLESPLVQTGAAIGSNFASLFPIGYRDRTLLLACGAAAAIATAFNAPIAGVLFALEVLLVDVRIAAFIPLLIAGATGALCSRIILSEGILLSFKEIDAFDHGNVSFYILLGIFCGALSAFYLKAFSKTETVFKKTLPNDWSRLAIGGALLGGLILLFPALFGEGYISILALASSQPAELFVGSPLHAFIVQSPWTIGVAVLAVGLVKVLAVSFTIHSGGNGGNFAPALLTGACVGFSFAHLLNTGGFAHLPLANFTLVAMAGMLTGIFHAPLTAIFLIAEVTGGYDLIIPLMIVAALSTAVSKYLRRYSLDEAALNQGPNIVAFNKDTHVLSELSTKRLIEKDFIPVHINDTLGALANAVAKSKRNVFPVLDDDGNLAGVVTLEDIREIMFNTSFYETTTVAQLMHAPQVTAEYSDDMAAVMAKFDHSGAWNMPVVNGGKYVGFISKSAVFTNYRDLLRED